jgi:hypothetical protein
MSIPTMTKLSAAHQAPAHQAPAHQAAPSKTRLWVVCCEQTEVTQQISKAVAQWQLPEVRSLFTQSLVIPFSTLASARSLPERFRSARSISGLLLSETVAQSDYAIFVTPYSQPSPHIKISPLNLAESAQIESAQPLDEHNPMALLSAIHNRYGQSPQSWWLQLPTTEIRARQICPVASQKSVAQALNQIGIFVRHYRLAVPQKRVATASKAINNQPKVSAEQLVASY